MSPTSNSFDKGNVRVSDFNVPHDSTNANYGWAKIQISLAEREHISALERMLNARFDKNIFEEVENIDKKKTK